MKLIGEKPPDPAFLYTPSPALPWCLGGNQSSFSFTSSRRTLLHSQHTVSGGKTQLAIWFTALWNLTLAPIAFVDDKLQEKWISAGCDSSEQQQHPAASHTAPDLQAPFESRSVKSSKLTGWLLSEEGDRSIDVEPLGHKKPTRAEWWRWVGDGSNRGRFRSSGWEGLRIRPACKVDSWNLLPNYVAF